MLFREDQDYSNIPVGPLGLIAMNGCTEMGDAVDKYLVEWRRENAELHKNDHSYSDYSKESFLIKTCCPRFGSGEAKGMIQETIRGDDLFILVDVTNYSKTYNMYGYENHMSPDDYFQDMKRIIAATGGKARRLNVIMPFLYESRQHKRSARESLDCAMALQELKNLGVENIITFDAHDARVQNAIPLGGFETVRPTYQFVKGLLSTIPDLKLDKDHFMTISPDEGATERAVYLSGVLGVDMGMFYKRRDYTRIVNGRNPIVAHEYLGSDLEGKDVLIIDDMIASGESILDVARELKARKAGRIFLAATFGLFTAGLDKFDAAHKEGIFTNLLSTNLVYQPAELLERPYYINCDMTKYLAYIIDILNHDASLSTILDPGERILAAVERYNNGEFHPEELL